jgi:hypothetical protein
VNAQHSMQTNEHGTPPEFVALGHAVFGEPDLDPASSAQWNGLIRAKRVITKAEGFWKTPWIAGAPAPNRLKTQPEPAPWAVPSIMYDCAAISVIANPPGDRKGVNVARMWWALTEYFALGWIRAALYIGFNVEQLSRLQRVGARTHPLQHVTLIPSYRHDYRIDAETVGEDAPHASFVTLLSRSSREIETFAALGSELGHVVNGDRRP